MTIRRLLLLLLALCPIHRASAMSGLQPPQSQDADLCPIHRAFAMSGNPAAQTPEPPSLAARVDEALHRESSGHSPTPEEIAAMSDLTPAPDAPAVTAALPLILKALDNPDAPLRAFALTTLVGLQSPAPVPPDPQPAAPTAAVPVTAPAADPETSPAAPAKASASAAPLPAAYKPDLAKILAPAIPRIAAHLTDDSQPIRLLAVTVLTGFIPGPPPAIYPPLLAYLKRDDAISPVGQAVVSALLSLGPLSADTAAAISRYLRRSDETPDARANLADGIASATNQSQSLNQALLAFLDSDDPSLRARIILSLPALDLAPDVFADTRARVAQLAENPGENLQVVTAAKAVTPCWTAPRMPSGCPVYP